MLRRSLTLLVALLPSTALAAIQVTSLPSNLKINQFEGDVIFLMQEATGLSVPGGATVDWVQAIGAGTFNTATLQPAFPGPTVVGSFDSWLAHYDPEIASPVTGSVEFSGEVVGIVIRTRKLNDLDLHINATTYDKGTPRGFEAPESFTISSDFKTVSFDFPGRTDYMEEVRILVVPGATVVRAIIPEPSTYLVFAGLALCFGLAGWWRKRKAA